MDQSGHPNRIEKNTHIVGDITSKADFRIDGTLEGTVTTSGKVVIGKEGSIQGKVNCVNADIEGTFVGNLEVSNMLVLKSTSSTQGEVVVGKLAVEAGANFNARCAMKDAAVKTLNKSDAPSSAEKTA